MSGTAKVAEQKWAELARENVHSKLKQFIKPLQDLQARDANEGDTRLVVTDMLCELLGYDKYAEISTEYMVRGEFADYALRIKGQIVAMVEVKRIATILAAKHLRQVEMYGINEGVEWLFLTNGAVWQIYRIIPGLPVSVDMVLSVDLLGKDALGKKADKLLHIHKAQMQRGTLVDLWKAAAATSPEKLVEVLLSETVTATLVKELRRQTGHRASAMELARTIRDSVIRPELVK
ncbi:MAG: hypothetical protein LBJ43_03190 [Propionibacteriaceae bacterium]|nr:hypothetical protein [Propionibacteriaceae bacterium]